MQWLTNLPLGDKPPLQIAAIAAIVLVVITALIIAYRALFGHRLRFSGGGKARQPRLGLVDAFSLDGQRQLVIVRRDNVEHLLMIGGPNDVVVESQIVRAQAQSLPRDKEVVASFAAPAQSQPQPQSQTQPQPQAQPQPQPQPQPPTKPTLAPTISPVRPMTPPGIAAIATPARAPIRPEPVAAVQPKAPPIAPAQSPPPVTPPPATPTFAPRIQPAAEAADSRPAPRPLTLPLRMGNPTAKSSPLPPPIVVSPAPSAPPTPAKPVVMPMPPAPPVQKAASPPTAPQGGSDAKGDPFAGLDSLEAEMARLLGRDP